MYSLVIVSVNEPLLAGLYDLDKKLCYEYVFYGHTTCAFNELFDMLFKRDIKIKKIYYARGPGRFSALKATHIYLHTLALSKGYELFSTSSFYFNGNNPIHAFANKCFVLDSKKILLKEQHTPCPFTLPQKLHKEDFDNDNNPLYILPAV